MPIIATQQIQFFTDREIVPVFLDDIALGLAKSFDPRNIRDNPNGITSSGALNCALWPLLLYSKLAAAAEEPQIVETPESRFEGRFVWGFNYEGYNQLLDFYEASQPDIIKVAKQQIQSDNSLFMLTTGQWLRRVKYAPEPPSPGTHYAYFATTALLNAARKR
jgi:hypothetical protein